MANDNPDLGREKINEMQFEHKYWRMPVAYIDLKLRKSEMAHTQALPFTSK
jgi:hypothetical protein